MLSRIGYGLAALVVVALAMACLAWTLLEPPALPVPPRGVVVIKDVTLVNPGLGRAAHVDITIRSGVITAIGPTTATTSRYDLRCGGCYALPGLIDMSAHLPPRDALGFDRGVLVFNLQHGVTMIRETAAGDSGVNLTRDAIAVGRLPGPRVVSCGRRIGDGADKPSWRIGTAAEYRAILRQNEADGARCVSIGWRPGPDAVMAIVNEAARSHLPIIAETRSSISLLDAPYLADVLGLSGVAPAPGSSAESPGDSYCAGFAALTDERLALVVAAAVRQHVAHTPLLSQGFDTGSNENPDACKRIRSRQDQVVRALFHAGVPIYAGSGRHDWLQPPRATLEVEIRRFAALGVTPEQALVTATTSPGRFWPEATYGQVAIGLPADIVLYRRDPTVSLDNLANRQDVIADGRVYASVDLDAWVRRYHAHLCGFVPRLLIHDGLLLDECR